MNLNFLLLGTVKGFSWNKITFLVVVSVNNDSTTVQSRPDVYPVSNCSLAGQKINGKKKNDRLDISRIYNVIMKEIM